MGPLSWDAELVKKAVGGTTNNDVGSPVPQVCWTEFLIIRFCRLF